MIFVCVFLLLEMVLDAYLCIDSSLNTRVFLLLQILRPRCLHGEPHATGHVRLVSPRHGKSVYTRMLNHVRVTRRLVRRIPSRDLFEIFSRARFKCIF